MDLSLIHLQYFQEMHDRMYHKDIHSMPLVDRLDHLQKHLYKYQINDVQRNSRYPDALACILSFANAINVNLADAITKEQGSIVLSISDIKPKWHTSVLHDLYRNTIGCIVKTIEGHDHTETIRYREDFKRDVVVLLIVLMQIFREIDERDYLAIEDEYVTKMFDLKTKSIFYPFNDAQDSKDPVYASFKAYNSCI